MLINRNDLCKGDKDFETGEGQMDWNDKRILSDLLCVSSLMEGRTYQFWSFLDLLWTKRFSRRTIPWVTERDR